MKKILLVLIGFALLMNGISQPVPAGDENIPHLMTFGPKAGTSWGDDDFSQAFFFLIPEDYDQPFFIRVFDPDIGGQIDEIAGLWNTRCTYEVFGGEGVWSDPDAQETSPLGNYKSGTMLASRAFAENPRFDNGWYTFGPFNPAQGYQILHHGNVHVLIFQLERFDEVFRSGLEAFFERPAPEHPAHTHISSEDERAGEAYREMLSRIRLPETYIERMYDSAYMRHFYTPGQIEGFRRKWRRQD